MSYQQPGYNPNYQGGYAPAPGYAPPPPNYGQQQPPPPPGWGPQANAYQQPYPGPPPPGTGSYAPNIDPETGQPKYGDGVGFSSTSIRAGFIRKVFGLVCIQLAIVTAFVAVCTTNVSVKDFVGPRGPGRWLYFVSYATFLVTYIAIACCEGVRRKHPINLILAGLLTLAISYMTGMIAAQYEPPIVLMTAGICAVCCFGIILFASQTKYDFTSCMGVMFVVFFVVFIIGIVAIIMLAFGSPAGYYLYLVYSGLMALVFMVYLAIDIQMIVGGKKYEISPEDYVFGAIQVFLDIIYIFWMLLSLIGGSSKD